MLQKNANVKETFFWAILVNSFHSVVERLTVPSAYPPFSGCSIQKRPVRTQSDEFGHSFLPFTPAFLVALALFCSVIPKAPLSWIYYKPKPSGPDLPAELLLTSRIVQEQKIKLILSPF